MIELATSVEFVPYHFTGKHKQEARSSPLFMRAFVLWLMGQWWVTQCLEAKNRKAFDNWHSKSKYKQYLLPTIF